MFVKDFCTEGVKYISDAVSKGDKVLVKKIVNIRTVVKQNCYFCVN